jgi:hypothetical protein
MSPSGTVPLIWTPHERSASAPYGFGENRVKTVKTLSRPSPLTCRYYVISVLCVSRDSHCFGYICPCRAVMCGLCGQGCIFHHDQYRWELLSGRVTVLCICRFHVVQYPCTRFEPDFQMSKSPHRQRATYGERECFVGRTQS